MIILMDIDHTISDAAWRDDLMLQARKTGNWDEYFRQVNLDKPIPIMIDIARYLSRVFTVVGLTGRPESMRARTTLWLKKHHVQIDKLLMRTDHDPTPTPEMKVKLITDNYELSQIAIVIEDRTDCITAFKAIGLNCIQFHDARRRYDIDKVSD